MITDTTATTGVVAVNGSTTGDIETTNEHDWFAVTLTAGHTYQFKVDGAATGQGSLNDPNVQLFDQNGAAVPGLGSQPGDPGITYTATSSATYYVAAGSGNNLFGTYTVSVVDLGVITTGGITDTT